MSYTPDSIVQTIIDKFIARAEFGEKKVWRYFRS
jgi:hypothetical protein